MRRSDERATSPGPERPSERADLVRALVLEAPRELVVRTFPRPAIADDDALLRIEACGLCGTDHEMWSGEMKKFLPLVPGHEAVGIIEEIGPRAADRIRLDRSDCP